ncbi:MAG: hypothetical protein JNN00_18385 [Chitinophagaceae bacterium]|nr:hypothetical protein [Chitinophagaceae bacterium]
MRRFPFLVIALVTTLSFILSCSKGGPVNNTPVCDNVTNKNFTADVNPIIQTFCNKAGCHNPGSVNGPGSLINYTEVFNARSAIRPAIVSGLMPQDATLTTAQRNTIICWIDSGAPNN